MTESTVRHATAEDLERVEPLWNALYKHQREHGMLLEPPENAYGIWKKSMAPILGRFALVVVAEDEGQLAGFLAGRVRTLPPYFGSAVTGTISELFVTGEHRNTGVGRKLLDLGTDWFRAQKIERIELQVMAGNPNALRFYERLGWRQELVQMIWNPGTPGPATD